MKKLALILLSLLMIACATPAAQNLPASSTALSEPVQNDAPVVSKVEETAVKTETEPAGNESVLSEAEAGKASGLPLFFNYFDSFDSGETEFEDWPKEGVMFNYDFDGDGETEDISYRITSGEEYGVDILFENQTYRLERVDFYGAALMDLDPESPYLNLLVVVDEGSDDYVTAELHLEDGKLTEGPIVYAEYYYEDGKLLFWERTEVLGTNFGARYRSGDQLLPENDWLDLYYTPTEEELSNEEELSELIEYGIVLEVIRELPCEIDGISDFLNDGDYLYAVRFKADGTAVECRTLSGEKVIIYGENESGWEFTINGEGQDYYFSNIQYFD